MNNLHFSVEIKFRVVDVSVTPEKVVNTCFTYDEAERWIEERIRDLYSDAVYNIVKVYQKTAWHKKPPE